MTAADFGLGSWIFGISAKLPAAKLSPLHDGRRLWIRILTRPVHLISKISKISAKLPAAKFSRKLRIRILTRPGRPTSPDLQDFKDFRQASSRYALQALLRQGFWSLAFVTAVLPACCVNAATTNGRIFCKV